MESGSVAIYAILFLISGVFLGCLLAWLLYRTNNGWICCRWFSTRGTNVDDSMLRVCDMKNRDQLSSSRNESQGYGVEKSSELSVNSKEILLGNYGSTRSQSLTDGDSTTVSDYTAMTSAASKSVRTHSNSVPTSNTVVSWPVAAKFSSIRLDTGDQKQPCRKIYDPRAMNAMMKRALSGDVTPPAERTCSSLASHSIYDSRISLGHIKPDLYTRKGSVMTQMINRAEIPLAKLHVCMWYDFARSDLVIVLMDMTQICSLEFGTFYFTTTLNKNSNMTKCSKFVQYRSTGNRAKMQIDESLKFPITFDELNNANLSLVLYYRKVAPTKAPGMKEKEQERRKLSLSSRAAKPHHSSQAIGKLTINLRNVDVSTKIELYADVEKCPDVENEINELLITLNYLPAASRLSIIIMKTRIARPHNAGRYYVTVSQKSNEKRYFESKNKKTNAVQAKPAVGGRLIEAEWNEEISFHMPRTSVHDFCFSLSVMYSPSSLQNYQTRRISKEDQEIVGSMFLSNSVGSEKARRHYNSVVQSHIATTMWHKLVVQATNCEQTPFDRCRRNSE